MFEVSSETKEILEAGTSLQDLLVELGYEGDDKYTKFVEWAEQQMEQCYSGQDAFQCVYPYMGDEEEGFYADQPIVWDGGFKVEDNRLVYSGMEGPCGDGKQVKRVVYDASMIVAME